jgi:cellulose synthase/poly-beta-1,6-N-acetylglucosamine synthase-like glycosyltransferase
VKILKAGYTVANENRAVAVTEAPETVKQFLKQRFRWTYGIMQMFWKQRQTFLNPNIKDWDFGQCRIFYCSSILFRSSRHWQMLSCFLEFYPETEVKYSVIINFPFGRCFIGFIAFIMQREKLVNLLYIIPQRFGYRWLMYIVLFKSLRKALKGEMQSWGFLKRTGNVKELQLLREEVTYNCCLSEIRVNENN